MIWPLFNSDLYDFSSIHCPDCDAVNIVIFHFGAHRDTFSIRQEVREMHASLVLAVRGRIDRSDTLDHPIRRSGITYMLGNSDFGKFHQRAPALSLSFHGLLHELAKTKILRPFQATLMAVSADLAHRSSPLMITLRAYEVGISRGVVDAAAGSEAFLGRPIGIAPEDLEGFRTALWA